MEVTLKKAATLALALNSIKTVIPHSFTVDICGPPLTTEIADDCHLRFLDGLDSAVEKITAVSQIRDLIGVANEGEINRLIAKKAGIEKLLAVFGEIPERKLKPDIATINTKAAGYKEAKGYSTPILSLEVETFSACNHSVKALRKERIKVDDRLAYLNFTTKIEIPEDVVSVLQKYDLV